MAVIVAAMLGLAFASVPLYHIFLRDDRLRRHADARDRAPPARSRAGSGFASTPTSSRRCRGGSSRRRRTVQPGARTDHAIGPKTSRPPDHRARGLQRLARPGGALFQQDRLLLLHRADAAAGPESAMPVIFFVDPKMRTTGDGASRNHPELHILPSGNWRRQARGHAREQGKRSHGRDQEPRLSFPPARSLAADRRDLGACTLFSGVVMWMHDNPYGKFVSLAGLLWSS